MSRPVNTAYMKKIFRLQSMVLTVLMACTMVIPGMCQVSVQKENSSAAIGRQLNLMPLPTQVSRENGLFRLDTTFAIAVMGKAGHRIFPYASRILRRLSNRTGLFFDQDYVNPDYGPDSAKMVIHIDHPVKLHLGMDESYQLQVTPQKISLTANTDVGALRGLETFLQLLKSDSTGYYIPAVNIHDAPRFKWRGLMMDCSRHFMTVAVLKRNIDGMAAMKLNVFHWHLSDDQGFRAQSKTFPKLTGDGSDGKYYSQAQIKDIIHYADQRGIRVVPEFDMPGHTSSWFVGYPKLASAKRTYRIQRYFGAFYPVMNPTQKYTYDFISKFLKEMTTLFPDAYFHIGGDEVRGKQWNNNKKIQAFMKAHHLKNNEELQSYFNRHLLKMLTRDHKKMIGWGEILQPGMPHNIVIQSWRGTSAMVKAAKKGYKSILSNGYYIDLVQPTDVLYLNNPLPPGLPLTPEQKKNILGGEATMWAEFVKPGTVDSRIWPRMAAIAEVFWSVHAPDVNIPGGYMTSVPDSIMTPKVRFEVHDMYRRLDIVSNQLEELGLRFKSNYPVMLRRLAGDNDIKALKCFVNTVEPVKIYRRPNERTYTQYSPLTRVVDAARPDSKVVRNFRYLVYNYLHEKNNSADTYKQIEQWLRTWKNNNSDLQETIKKSPILDEISPLSKKLSGISEIGLQALVYKTTSEKAGRDWEMNSMKTLKAANQPLAQVRLMVVKPIEDLVMSVGPHLVNQSNK